MSGCSCGTRLQDRPLGVHQHVGDLSSEGRDEGVIGQFDIDPAQKHLPLLLGEGRQSVEVRWRRVNRSALLGALRAGCALSGVRREFSEREQEHHIGLLARLEMHRIEQCSSPEAGRVFDERCGRHATFLRHSE